MSYKNLKNFIESTLNFNHDLAEAQSFIKENYNTESSYDEETGTLNIWNENINESVQIVAAKEYLEEKIGLDKIQIVFGKD